MSRHTQLVAFLLPPLVALGPTGAALFPAQPGVQGGAARPTMGSDPVTIALEPRLLPNAAPLFGMSNLFFKAPDGVRVRCPAEWQKVQIADIVEGGRFRPVWAVFFTDRAGSVQYVVDSDSDGDVTSEKPLVFHAEG